MANEKRLIDANALLQDNEEYFCKPCKEEGHDYHEVACRACWVDDMRIAIEDAPTVDAVEVVRCKDCNKSVRSPLFGSGWRFCKNNSQHHKDEHFCSYGERKDGDGNG